MVDSKPEQTEPGIQPLEIIYQDTELVAINKPTGLLVHRSAIDKRETRFALQLVRDQIGQRVYPAHRLDKPTAGVLLFALSPEIAKQLMQQFQDQSVTKTYLAITRGFLPATGRIDYPLQEEQDKMTDARAKPGKAPQAAVTDYTRLATVELPYPVGRYPTARYSLACLRPRTGRKHQLRRHLKHIFHPIVGDTTHGDGKQNRFFRDRFQCRRLLLSCIELQLRHPTSGAELNIRAPLDQEFEKLLALFNLTSADIDATLERGTVAENQGMS